ncbi:MAG TPA: division/cell wall cluster transcriptional repressor MraZ [Casimicrobiaceae bacterium]|nr:division/cell wall cluster transcriptional repressor MraZ [Casimicrobiaceae bacterium]
MGGNEHAGGTAEPTPDGAANGHVFRGVSDLVLDAKGRLAIPARHRDGLFVGGSGKLIVTADLGGCLLVYPLVDWRPLERELMSLSGFDARIRSLQRLMVGHADEVDIDAAGRILVPPALRRYAGLDKRVVLVGQGRKLELWDDAKWQAQIAQPISFPDGLPPGLEGLSL